jgi:ABC-type multidrug transport system ATPase subunit
MIAYIPQENFSVPQLSGRENLLYFASILGIGRREARKLVNQVLEKVGLTREADKRFANYSGGMKKRLELATALFPGVRLLILDEPTTGLDPAARRDFFTMLKNIKHEQASIFLITHLGSDAESASRVGLIREGRVIAEGTPYALRQRHAPEEAITIETAAQNEGCESVLKAYSDGHKLARLPNDYRIYAHDGGLEFAGGSINAGDRMEALGRIDKETNTIVVADQGDYIRTYAVQLPAVSENISWQIEDTVVAATIT